jgi:hypothetical protein
MSTPLLESALGIRYIPRVSPVTALAAILSISAFVSASYFLAARFGFVRSNPYIPPLRIPLMLGTLMASALFWSYLIYCFWPADQRKLAARSAALLVFFSCMAAGNVLGGFMFLFGDAPMFVGDYLKLALGWGVCMSAVFETLLGAALLVRRLVERT